ncbi:MAG: sigma-70 family RNA polymerase sigma factor [Kofleriaceae bacterium]
MEDDDIRQGLRAGDVDDAFRILIERHGAAARAVCLVLLRDVAAAEDALQDAFAKAYRKRRRLAAANSLGAYLRRIAERTALDVLRRDKRRRRLARDKGAGAAEVASTQYQIPLVEPADAAALLACLDQLEAKTRLAVLRFFQDETPWQDIAREVGLEVDTIRMRATRSLKSVRLCLESKGVTP